VDSQRFDTLVKTLSAPGTRRGVLRLLAAVPVAGGLLTLLEPDGAQGKGAKRHQTGNGGKDGRGKDGKRDQSRDKGTVSICRPESKARTCRGRCGKVKNICGKRINCGACPECSSDGECGACQICQEGRCTAPCDGTGCCDDNGECHDGRTTEFCGRDGQTCVACDGEEICRADDQGETCRLNQPPDAFNQTYNDDWGKACIVVTLLGADPDGDPLAFRVLSNPTNGRLFLYDEGAVDHLGVEVHAGDPAVPAEAGSDGLRLCYKTNNRYFFGSDSFRYIAIDTYGAESPVVNSSPGPPPTTGKSFIQINVFET
jgi:hypothetical protein